MNTDKPKRVRQPRFTDVDSTVGDCISSAFSTFEELKDELENWYDNLPENLQSGSKGDMLQEAIDTLSNLQEPDIPEHLTELPVKYRSDRKATSRANRCGEACSMLDCVISVLQEREQTLREEAQSEQDDAAQTSDESDADTSSKDAQADDCQTLIDEIDNAKSDAENVEFPGMFG